MYKELFSCGANEFAEMSIAEAIAWLSELAEGQPFGPDQIKFRIEQDGDHWDGYSAAVIKVYRDETQEEAHLREEAWRADAIARQAQAEAQERAQLEHLKAKYEKEHGANASG